MDIADNASALADDVFEVAEIVVEQDHVGAGLRGVGGFREGDGEVGAAQGEDVVHAVAGHGDALALGLERLDELAFLLGLDAAEHGDGIDGVGNLSGSVERLRIDEALGSFDTRLDSHLRDRQGVVARDYLHLDALAGKFRERLGGVSAHGIGNGDEEEGRDLLVFCLDEREHAHAGARALLECLAASLQRGISQDEFRRTEAEGSAVDDNLRILEL